MEILLTEHIVTSYPADRSLLYVTFFGKTYTNDIPLNGLGR